MMSLFFGRQRRGFQGMTAQEHIQAQRGTFRPGAAAVSADTALRHSAVWAATRLRADLVSSMPVDAYRKLLGVQVEVTKPQVLIEPGGSCVAAGADRIGIAEWLYSTQVDLDRYGNTIGLITERTSLGLASRVDLVSAGDCTVVVKQGKLKYRIAGKEYEPRDVWHERQYTVAGLPVGLSPIAYAAWTISEYLSIQDFALDWFGNGGVPAAHLKNNKKTLTPEQAAETKQRFSASVSQGGLFVSGADWEYNVLASEQAGTTWLEAKGASVADVARFMGVPGDLIDAPTQSGNITYANITERNLQFLIMHLGPAVARRETALSRLLSSPRFVKLNSDALLRMDPKTRAEMFKVQIESRQRVPSETRALDNLPPFTPEQLEEFKLLTAEKAGLSPAEVAQKGYLAVGKGLTSDELRQMINDAGGDLPIPGPEFPTAASPIGAPSA